MCFREYISYQCAHRSPPVLRTCAMTTEGHNNPVCDKRPDRQWVAETGCTVCERCHHGRWVMIREREHRWMHERGACGCDVVFQGLLNTPQVSGLDVIDPQGVDGDSLVITDESRLLSFGVEAFETQETKGKVKETTTSRRGSVPPLYTEVITPEGKSHVSLRIKSLYAGEWRDDHRVLHETGRCNCRASFTSFTPFIPDEELTEEERKIVQQQRDQEDAAESLDKEVEHHQSGFETEEVAVGQRLKEIEETFGSFQVSGRFSHRSVPTAVPGTAIAESSDQGYRRMGRKHAHHKSQPSVGRRNSQGQSRDGKDLARDRSQTHPLESQRQNVVQAHSQSGSGAPSSMALANQGWVYDPLNELAQGQNASPHALGVFAGGQSQQDLGRFRCSPGFDYSSLDDLNYVDVVGMPICGIPIGGEAHMPQWSRCVLRKSRQPAPQKHISRTRAAAAPAIPRIVVEKTSTTDTVPRIVVEEDAQDTTGLYIVIGYNSHCPDTKSDAGYGTTEDDGAIEDGDLLGPGGSSPPQRRHSAVL